MDNIVIVNNSSDLVWTVQDVDMPLLIDLLNQIGKHMNLENLDDEIAASREVDPDTIELYGESPDEMREQYPENDSEINVHPSW